MPDERQEQQRPAMTIVPQRLTETEIRERLAAVLARIAKRKAG